MYVFLHNGPHVRVVAMRMRIEIRWVMKVCETVMIWIQSYHLSVSDKLYDSGQSQKEVGHRLLRTG